MQDDLYNEQFLTMQVILVGHDVGGACISHAMEMHPTKVCKAIFVAATMLCNDQSALDIFSQQVCKQINKQKSVVILLLFSEF